MSSSFFKKIRGNPDIQWLSFFLLLIFPVLGNAICYGWIDSRRIVQVLLLAIGVLSVALSFNTIKLRMFKSSIIFSTITSLVIFSLCLCLSIIGWSGERTISLLAFQKATFIFIYLYLFLVFTHFFVGSSNKLQLDSLNQNPYGKIMVPAVVFLLGMFIVFKAWWIGPMELQAHIDFGGSTTIVGLCATSAFFVILFALPHGILVRFFVSFPYLYLLFFSTSRTAYVVFFTFGGLLFCRVVAQSIQNKKTLNLRGLALAALPLAVLMTVILPLKISSRIYPYYIPKDVQEKIWTYDGRSAQMKSVGYERLIVYRQEELWNRLSRFLRALYNFYQSPIIRDLRESINNYFKVDLMPDILIHADDYMIKGGHDPSDRWARLAAQSTRGESRTQIIRKTNVLISEKYEGWWPETYPSVIDFYCNKGAKCRYPHNIILEVTFYFGILMGIVYFVLILMIVWIVGRLSLKSQDHLTVALSVGILVALFGAQFTGTFYDLVVAGMMLVLLLTRRSLFSKSCEGDLH